MSSHHVSKQPDKHLRAIQQALANLCVGVKMKGRGREKGEKEKGSERRWEEEKATLKEVDALLLVERLQEALETMWGQEQEEGEREGRRPGNNDSRQEDPPHDYEQLIQQLEAEVRLHIRVC
jgi:hypothetical protein